MLRRNSKKYSKKDLQLFLQFFTSGRVGTIYELITAPNLATYWEERPLEQGPYLGEVLFPNDSQLGTDISMLKGEDGAPIALRPSAFDVQAIPRDRKAFDQMLTELIFFKESKFIYEKDRQMLQNMIAAGNQRQIDIVLGKIFDDITELLRAASLQREIMRMEMLTTGAMRVSGNGQDHFVDYGFNSENKGYANVSWSDAENSDPINDIRMAQQQILLRTGVKPTRMILNTVTLNRIIANKLINKTIAVFGNGLIDLTEQQIRNHLNNRLGVSVVVYDQLFITHENGVKQVNKFIPDDLVVLTPPTTLGRTVFGTTPEEADLMNSNTANVSIVDTGVAITTTVKADPVNVDTKVSMIMLPTYERMGHVYILEANAPSTAKKKVQISAQKPVILEDTPPAKPKGLGMKKTELIQALQARKITFDETASEKTLEALLLKSEGTE